VYRRRARPAVAREALSDPGDRAGSRSRRTPAAGRPGCPGSCGDGSGRPWAGSCTRCRVCAGRRGWRGSCRPCRPGPCPVACEAPLPSGDQQGHDLLSLLARQVNLRGQPATRTSQRVISGLAARSVADSTRRFLLLVRPGAGLGGVLLRPGNRGVHAHLPADQPHRIGPCPQGGNDPLPHPGPLPAAEQGVHRLPGAIAVRHIPPRRTHPHPPPDPINELPFRPLRRPTRLRGHEVSGSEVLLGR
jgi:hypothetical protein